MALDKPYARRARHNRVRFADMARRGYHLNQFCMSLMNADNRERFSADERAYLDEWPMSDAQKQAVLDRDYNRMISLGGNIYFLAKIFSLGWHLLRAGGIVDDRTDAGRNIAG